MADPSAATITIGAKVYPNDLSDHFGLMYYVGTVTEFNPDTQQWHVQFANGSEWFDAEELDVCPAPPAD